MCGDHRQRRLLVYCNLYYRWTVRASYVGNIALGGDHMQRRLLYIAIFTRTISCLICGKCWGNMWLGPQAKTTFLNIAILTTGGLFHASNVANVGGACCGDHRQRRLLYIAIFTMTIPCLICGKCWWNIWLGPQAKTTI